MRSLSKHIDYIHFNSDLHSAPDNIESDGFKSNYPGCYSKFASARDVLLHQQSSNHLTKECVVCGQTFKYMYMLNKHVGMAHFTTSNPDLQAQQEMQNLQSRECAICEKTFSDAATLKRHTTAVHIKKSYKCKICNRISNRMDNFKRHMMTRHGLKVEMKEDRKVKSLDSLSTDLRATGH